MKKLGVYTKKDFYGVVEKWVLATNGVINLDTPYVQNNLSSIQSVLSEVEELKSYDLKLLSMIIFGVNSFLCVEQDLTSHEKKDKNYSVKNLLSLIQQIKNGQHELATITIKTKNKETGKKSSVTIVEDRLTRNFVRHLISKRMVDFLETIKVNSNIALRTHKGNKYPFIVARKRYETEFVAQIIALILLKEFFGFSDPKKRSTAKVDNLDSRKIRTLIIVLLMFYEFIAAPKGFKGNVWTLMQSTRVIGKRRGREFDLLQKFRDLNRNVALKSPLTRKQLSDLLKVREI
ncbi:MAG: hypothetical protein ORN56_01985 [Chitinophagales bacterium]|nr:hypothetical protein [Chitinophagales bacterium]